MCHELINGHIIKEFKGSQINLGLKGREHIHDVTKAVHTQNHDIEVLWLTLKFDLRVSDKTKGSLSTDKQLTQVVTRGVFDHTAVEVQDIPFTRNDR